MAAKKKPEPPKKPEPKGLAQKVIQKAATASRKAAKRPVKGKGAGKGDSVPVKALSATFEDDATDDAGELCGLTVREARFIDIYLLTHRVEQSYIEAGFKAKAGPSAQACASRLLSSAKSRAYLAKRSKAMFEDLAAEQSRLMRNLTDTAYSDPRELVLHVRGACRHCHGKMHRHQYTAGEWDAIMTKHAEKQEKAAENERPMPPEPDPKGGTGYRRGAAPHPDCPECDGWGEGRNIVRDHRDLSPAAVALLVGVKEGKDGTEARMHDQMKAREMLAKTFKLYEDATSVNVSINPAELDKLYGETMRKGAERMEQMREQRRAARTARGD